MLRIFLYLVYLQSLNTFFLTLTVSSGTYLLTSLWIEDVDTYMVLYKVPHFEILIMTSYVERRFSLADTKSSMNKKQSMLFISNINETKSQ